MRSNCCCTQSVQSHDERLQPSLFLMNDMQVIKYYADKVISFRADKAQSEVAKDIDGALA